MQNTHHDTLTAYILIQHFQLCLLSTNHSHINNFAVHRGPGNFSITTTSIQSLSIGTSSSTYLDQLEYMSWTSTGQSCLD